MPKLRYFNNEGRKLWSKWLDLAKENPLENFPTEILADPASSSKLMADIDIPETEFESKFEMAKALSSPISEVFNKRIITAEKLPGMWDWLCAQYFTSICPLTPSGKFKLKQKARYSFDSDFRRSYRHRVYGPVNLYLRTGMHSRILLHGAPSSLTDWEEQAASRYYITANPKITEALFSLYWDPSKQAPRRGAAPNKKTPGTLRRFDDVTRQLDLTYDLLSVPSKTLLGKLPKEFNRFKP